MYRIKSVSDLQISPDGKSAAFTVAISDLGRAKRSSHIWRMDPDGRNLRQLTFSEQGENSPLFSPDGNRISFISARDGDSNLYLLPTAEGEARQLTRITTGVPDPVWAPDSKPIAFSTDVYTGCGADDACNQRISSRWPKVKLQFTPSGRIQFLKAVSYIHQDNPPAAVKFRNRAAQILRRLTEYPESGRLIPEFPDLPFREVYCCTIRFFYRHEGKTIWVVACWHGAQLPTEPAEGTDV